MIRRTLLVSLLPLSLALAAACASPGSPRADAAAVFDPSDTTLVWDTRTVTTRPELANPEVVRRALAQNYPTLLRDAGVIGSVTLEILISRDGTVERADVVNASHEEFAAAARKVALQMRFRPAMVRGIPVRFRDTLPVSFDLVVR
jgi:TonB family protein